MSVLHQPDTAAHYRIHDGEFLFIYFSGWYTARACGHCTRVVFVMSR